VKREDSRPTYIVMAGLDPATYIVMAGLDPRLSG
jgi:hypothetical protein